jgi:hypothetical protein
MPPDLRLKNAGQDLLDNLAAELVSRGIDVPDDRRYIHSGVIAHDFAGEKCVEAFIVAWTGSSQGELGSPTQPTQGTPIPIRCSMPLNHTFAIAMLRCVPIVKQSGQPPSADDLQSSGEQILTDAMTLCAAIVDLEAAHSLITTYEYAQAGIITTTPIGPQGGVGGVVVQLAVSLTV